MRDVKADMKVKNKLRAAHEREMGLVLIKTAADLPNCCVSL